MKQPKPPKKSPELATFERKAKALLKKIETYALTGGDVNESKTNRETEMGFYRGRDRLEDDLRKLGLSDDREAIECLARVKHAASAAPELAREKRTAHRDKQIAELDERAREHRAWRIANGLEDPPKHY